MTPDNKPQSNVYEQLVKHQRAMDVLSSLILFSYKHLIPTKEQEQEHKHTAAEHVNRGDGGLLIVANHLSMLDVKAMFEVRSDINPDIPFTVLWADKFVGKDTEVSNSENTVERDKWILFGTIGEQMASRAGMRLVSVPQTASQECIRRADKIITQVRDRTLAQNAVLGFFPEGTRSKSGMLQKAKAGALNRLFRDYPDIQEKTLILPIAIQNTNNIKALKPITIQYGKPFTYEQAIAEMKDLHLNFLADDCMLRIARMLPPNMWGEYAEQFKHIIHTSASRAK